MNEIVRNNLGEIFKQFIEMVQNHTANAMQVDAKGGYERSRGSTLFDLFNLFNSM